MKIREEQMGEFRHAAEKSFVNTVIRFLQENHLSAVTGLSDDLMKILVSNGLDRAKSYGIESDSGLKAFVAIMFETAPNFDEQPNIKSILEDDALEPNERLKVLSKWTTDEDWEEVLDNYDDSAWYPVSADDEGEGE